MLRNTDVYFTLGNFAVFVLILLGGGLIPYYYLPYGLDQFARVLPHYNYLQRVQRITLTDYEGLGLESLGIVLVSLLLLGLGITIVNRQAGDQT